MIEHVTHGDQTLAIIIRADFKKEGIEFVTPGEYSQQLAYMNRPEGYRIQPHVHNPVHRELNDTMEVLFIKSGRVQIDFYDNDKNHLEDRVVSAGDTILLASGGHGFRMLEASEIIEVKQGPYAGENDKTRFGE